jgi:hypothetical protein
MQLLGNAIYVVARREATGKCPVGSRWCSGVCIGAPTRHNMGKVTYVHLKGTLIDSEATMSVP